MAHISDVPAVRPFETGVLRRDVLKAGNPRIAPDAMTAFKILRIEESLQVQVVCHAALDVGDIVPTFQPVHDFPIFLPLPLNLAALEGKL